MKEYQIGRAMVRIHGEANPEKVKEAFTSYMKKVEKQRRRKKNENGKAR